MDNSAQKKILVVGANSFIGNQLIRALKEQARVTGVYHINTDRLLPGVPYIAAAALADLEPGFDEVYIISAYIPGKQPLSTDRRQLFNANVSLVADICERFGNSRIVYASSVAVYRQKESAITENDNEGALNEYGVSKLWGEKIVQQVASHAIVRFSSVYGPGMKLNTILPAYIQQALQQQCINVWGNGSRQQNYIHVSDAIQFLLRAGAVPGNGVFLATAAQGISNLELAESIARITGAVIAFNGTDSSGSFLYNNAVTTGILQYTAAMPAEKGIAEMILWLQKKYSSPA